MRFITPAIAAFAAAVALAASAAAQPAATAVSKIVGERHKRLLDAEGRVFGWGAFDDGQLGPEGGTSRLDAGFGLPVPIALPGRARDVAAGEYTSSGAAAPSRCLSSTPGCHSTCPMRQPPSPPPPGPGRAGSLRLAQVPVQGREQRRGHGRLPQGGEPRSERAWIQLHQFAFAPRRRRRARAGS